MKTLTQILPLILFFLALGLFLIFSIQPRLHQLTELSKEQGLHPTVPIFSTMDAPYFVLVARALNDPSLQDYKTRRSYPDLLKPAQPAMPSPSIGSVLNRIHPSFFKIPLISHIMATGMRWWKVDAYTFMNHLIPFLASLFIIPLAFYFYRLGYPFVGLLGGITGSLGFGYLGRTSIGRIDTDMLNLFFPFMASFILLWFYQSDKKRKLYPQSILLGVTLCLFMWWYTKTIFMALYIPIFIVLMCLKRLKPPIILLNLIVVMVVSGPLYFLRIGNQIIRHLQVYGVNSFPFLEKYVGAASRASLNFPGVSQTISEIKTLSPNQLFALQVDGVIWAWLGLGIFLAFAIKYWRQTLPLLPILLIGLTSLKLGRRFVMYLNPFIGIGLGLGMTWIIHSIPQLNRFFKKLKWGNLVQDATGYCLAIGLAFVVMPEHAHSFIPKISINPQVVESYDLINNYTPRESAILTWWDPGYLIAERTGRYVFHDGGQQSTPRTYLIARALTSSSQQEFTQIIRFVGTKGRKGIDAHQDSIQTLDRAIAENSETPGLPVYAFFTSDMVPLIGAIHYLGQWDFQKNSSRRRGYISTNCLQKNTSSLVCKKYRIDLEKGLVNQKTPIKKAIWIQDGRAVREKSFENANGYYVEIVKHGRGQGPRLTPVYLMDEVIYKSNFNQLFFLGAYDPELFEEVSAQMPTARLYRMKFAPRDPDGTKEQSTAIPIARN